MALEPITRQEQIIAGKDLEPITRMEMFLKQYGGASSWNDLTDKPFGEEKAFEPIVWDGNTEGLESYDLEGTICFKIADYIPITSVEQIDSMVLKTYNDGTIREVTASASEIAEIAEFGSNFFAIGGYLFGDGDPIAFPSSGIWLDTARLAGLSLNPATTIKPLDEKYLPILTSPSGKKFKLSVDDSGVLSATEV